MPPFDPDEWYDEATLARRCSSCGARPDQLCVTGSGKPVKPHSARFPATVRTQARKSTDPTAQQKRTVARRSGGWCEVCPLIDPAAPRHAAEQVHHRQMRSCGGTNDPSNLLHTCRRGHALVHDHPERAYQAGALIRASSS